MSSNPIVIRNTIHLIDTRVYDVEFSNGDIQKISANRVAKYIFQKWNLDSNTVLLLKHILYHNNTEYAVSKDEELIKWKNCKIDHCNITKVCELLFKWANGKMMWEQQSNTKESYPYEVTKHANVSSII